ncbi:MAG: cytochrome c biogenesis protein ResB [Thermodesulfobacteriota bacterium]
MSTSISNSRLTSRLWGQLTSIRLTVFLLLILAVVAVVGTLGFPGLYYTIWFLAPLGLLALNLLACLVEGLPQALKRAARPFTGEMALALPERGRFSWPAETAAPALVEEILRRELGRPRHQILGEEQVFFYGRGRLRPLGPYCVHLALVLILAGGVVGKFWGIEGRILLQPGIDGSSIELDQPGRKLPLGFLVRLEKFQVRYYEGSGGTPQEFRSDLTFLQDGAAVKQAVCRVNDPVVFGGYTFYQASYGTLPGGPVQLELTREDQRQSLELPFRRWVQLPGSEIQVMAVRVEGNLQGLGPAVQLAYRPGPGHPQFAWLLQKHPEKVKPLGPFRLALAPLKLEYYSVLQVKHDPGVGWVYGGFLLLLPGLYLAFFRPTQRWAVVLQKGRKDRWEGRLLGASPRSRETFLARTERLRERLQRGGA